MTMPIAYEPVKGFKYQILAKTPYERAYEHVDYAVDRQDKNYLLQEYQLAFQEGYSFKVIQLPKKY